MTGFELRIWRRGHSWTQERAAEELGVCLRTYKTYEKSAPPKVVILATRGLDADKATLPPHNSVKQKEA